jgi:hypothetical protein
MCPFKIALILKGPKVRYSAVESLVTHPAKVDANFKHREVGSVTL